MEHAWTATGDLNTGRYAMGSGGTATSAICIAGGEPKTGKTELFDGSTWTEVTDLNTARQTLGGAGANNTSGIACGGDAPPGSPSYVSATELFTGAGADMWSMGNWWKFETQVEEDLLV